MVSSNLYISLCLVMTLLVVITQAGPFNYHKSRSHQQLHDKRGGGFLRPKMDDSSRCIYACGKCADDLDVLDDKVRVY